MVWPKASSGAAGSWGWPTGSSPMAAWCIPAGGGALAGRAHAGRRDGLPDRLDDQELHRGGGAGAAGRRPAGPGRPGRGVRARAARPGAAEPRLAAGLPPAPAHHDRRVPDRRSLGGPAAGAPAGRVLRVPGRRPELRLGARDPVRVLQPRLRDPRPGRHRGHRPALSRVRAGPAAPPAGDDQQRVRGGGIRRPAAGPRVPARGGRLERARAGRLRGLRPDGRRVQLRDRPGPLGERFHRRVPAR